ncbi:hypothetical protein [Erysipelothrix rhusiopathiae]|uniref:hypothetical protein n=1 Tax=Erysipelothrix rhusiopathiae TaxID=1648 RepID=UPI002B2555A7|nr:hypothetical protein [Erysipelothrix rhusiopathiae]WRB92939.1 hypothetical protein LL063_08240 [Erysipelothrix rhusiopathiae]
MKNYYAVFIAFTLVVLTRTVIHPDLLLTVTGIVTFLVILVFATTQIFNLKHEVSDERLLYLNAVLNAFTAFLYYNNVYKAITLTPYDSLLFGLTSVLAFISPVLLFLARDANHI